MIMQIDASKYTHRELNEILRQNAQPCEILNCLGQRFIAAGLGERDISIHGIPGNALGAYLNGARIVVHGNAQDAIGDTMNDGEIVVHGNVGDAAGYAMRGGAIYIRGNAGYRTGIHMKAYREKQPAIVIGGRAGSFLGEYQAGGLIVVLGLHADGMPIVSNFSCTGMHGGKMFLRSDCREILFPDQVTARPAQEADMAEIKSCLEKFCAAFNYDYEFIAGAPFTVVTPDSKNPYKQMYVAN